MTVYYFAYRTTDPLPSMALIDAREMPNQYQGNSDNDTWQRVRAHPLFEGLVKNTIEAHKEYNHVAVGCDFGIHRSKAIAESAAAHLGIKVKLWNSQE